MKTQNIQEQISDLEREKEEIDKKIVLLKNQLNTEESEWVPIPGTDYEVTKDVLHKGKLYREIMQLKKPDEELLTLKQIGIICEYPELVKNLKMDSSSTKDYFFFKQPFKQNENRGYVAGFYAGSDYAGLVFDGSALSSNSYLGVRWVRKKKGKKNV